MYKYITILGAAGQIAQRLTATLLTYTDMHITLYGRQLSTRVHPEILEHERITVIEGSFQNPKKLEEAVYDILHVEDETPFNRASIGVGEPGTHYNKPSFLLDTKTIFLILNRKIVFYFYNEVLSLILQHKNIL